MVSSNDIYLVLARLSMWMLRTTLLVCTPLCPTTTNVDELTVPHPAVSSVVTWVDPVPKPVAQSLERPGSYRGESATRLDMQHDVDIVRRSDQAETTVHRVQLSHEPADEGPSIERQHLGYLSHVGPRVRPAAHR